MALLSGLEEGQNLPRLMDLYGRVVRKLRISVTDRCNFRCSFCMPETPAWIPNDSILSFDEITRFVRVCSTKFGVDRVRLSGGEPLVRKDIEKLVAQIAFTPGIKHTCMTTNGTYLAEKARSLKNAGLQSVTISLHSLRPERFEKVTRVNGHAKVLEGIRAAKSAGFVNVKLNSVIVRGYNDDEILDFATLAHDEGFNMRFIEYMPFDGRKSWQMEKVVSGDEILARIAKKYRIVPLERERGSTAVNYRFEDGAGGEFGIIASITRPFCSDCDRLRLTADGKLVPCLFGDKEYDISPLLKDDRADDEIAQFLKEIVRLKPPGVESLIKASAELKHVRAMYQIGG